MRFPAIPAPRRAVLTAWASCLLLSSLPAPAGAAELTDIRVALAWLRNGQYAALYLADTQGYFAQEGLRVTFLDGGPGKNPVPLVAAGQAQFGVTRGPDIFNARVAPVPVDVTAVGAIVQKDPVVFLTIQDKSAPPPTPKDMEGKIIGVQPGSDFTLKGLASKSGADYSTFKLFTVGATAEPLLVGRVDFYTAILTNQVYQVEQELAKQDAPARLKGKVLGVVSYYDNGIPSYADVLFTTATTIQTNPDLVGKFVRAAARGVQFMVEHPDDAARIVATYPNQIEDETKLAWRFNLQRQISVSADTAKNGYLWMEAALWNASMNLYRTTGQVDRVVDAGDYMDNRFNPHILSVTR